MKITKYNKNLATTTTITVATETTAYPAVNMLSDALVEATLITTDVIADFGSAVTGSNFIAVKVSDNITSLKIDGNATDSWGTPTYTTTLSTKYSGYFILDLGANNFEFYRFTPTGTGDLYFNWLYLGEQLSFPNLNVGSFPDVVKDNISNATNSKQVYKTSGVAHYEQTVSFSNIPKATYQVFEDWWVSTDSTYNQLFYQYDDRLATYIPYYCSIENLVPTSRSKDYYDFKIEIREAK